MRQQRLTEAFSHRNQIGFIKPAIIIFLCSAVFVGGVYLSIAGPYANDESDGSALQKSGATVETFEIDTSGIVGGQSLSVGGQLRVNNTLVLSPSSQPAETSAGQIYFDAGAKEIRYYDGTSFQGLASTGDVEAALQQQPPAQQPSVGSASQNITNITQQTINNYETATGTVTETGNNTFTGANTFTDISVEDFTASGSAALQGSLTVTGTTLLGPASASSLLLSSALDVSSGGTGRDTFSTNEIVIGQGSGALATISNGAPGLCLVSTAGAPSFQACPGGGSAGVSSLAGLTGDLLVANSSTSGSTITIDTATSTNRGLASFNAANLTVTGGSVNTVQDIAVTAAPTFAGITVNGLINGQTISSAASLTGTLSVAGATTATGGIITNSITSASGLSVGSSAQTLSLQGGASSTFSATSGANTTTLQFQTPTANANYRFATATAGTYDVCTTTGNCVGVGGSVSTSGGTNGQIAKFDSGNNIVDSLLSESGVTVTADGNFNIAAGSEYQIDGVQISSSVLSNDSNLAKLNASQTFSGQTIFRNTVDSSAALSLQNAAGNDLATLNTTNGSFELGDSSTLDGKLVVRNATNNFTVTVNASSPTGNHTVSLGNESGTICLQNSSGCGFITGAAANANYVQNQNSAQQVGGNFWIAGTGRADTVLQAPVFDAASSGALTLGGANATSIAVMQDTTLAASKSLTITGGATGTRPASPTEGMVYYDTSTKQLITYANGKWQADRSANTKIVAASNSTQANKDAADYVADGTGDEVEINAALTAATGGKVYLMEGTYTASATILVPNDTVLSGAGRGTLIQLADIDASDNLIENASAQPRVTIRDLRIDGQKSLNTAGTQNGIYLNGGAGTVGPVVENVEILNFRTTGLNSRIAYASITNVTSESNTWRGFDISVGTHQELESVTARSNGQQGILIDSGADLSTVTDSKSISNSDRGVRIIAAGVKVSNNTVTGNSSTGIEVGTDRTTVTGNTVTGNPTGIVVTGNNNTITDNSVSSNTGTGISVSTSTNTTISSNYIGSNGSIGIAVGGIVGITITSNTINSNASYGIQLDLTDQALIANNYISNNGGAGGSSSIRVYSGCCGAPDENRIIDNVITDTAGTGFAILIANGSRNYLSGNTYSGTGAASISDTGTNTIYVNQIDANGHLINRGTAAISVNTATVTSSFTLQGGMTNTQLPTPAIPVITRVGTAGTTTYGYKVTALDGTGETLPSTEGTIATANATLTGANYNTITWAPVPGAVQYKIYRTTSGGTPATLGLIGTVNGSTTISLNDTGLAASTAEPSANTTGGLSVVSNIQGSNATFTGGTLTLGTTAQQGSLVISDGSSNTATIQVGDLAGNYTYTIPVTTGNDTFCMLVAANCSGGGVSAIGALDGGAANATGATITGSTLYLQSASGTNPGLVNTATQTFAGDKTFTGTLSVQNTTVGAGTGIAFVGGITSTRPAVPSEGMVYFDTSTKQLITYANGKWQGDRNANTKIVAASNSTQTAKDVADYVATGTNDQTQINAAITAATGGTVYLMEGTYTVGSAILVPDNTTLAGAGRGTLIRLADIDVSANAIQDSGSGKIIIRDLRVDGQKSLNTAGTQHGIYLDTMGATAPGPSVENVEVSNFRNNGIELRSTDNATLTNVISSSNNVGVYMYPGSDWNQLSRIRAQSNVSHGIHISNGTNNSLRDSISQLNGGYGYLTADNNQVVESSSFISNTTAGMGLNNDNHRIVDNVIRSNTGSGIYLDGSDVQISSNEISSNGSTGIYVDLSEGNSKITNNTIVSNTGSGINGSRANSNMLITGNYLKSNTGWGVELNGFSHQLISNETVNDNTVVSNASGGIQLASASSSSVVGNMLINNGGTTTNNGISISNSYSGNNNIASNTVTDDSCTTSCYSITINGRENQISSNTIGDAILVNSSGNNIYGRGEILDSGTNTIYVNQRDTNGNLLNRGGGGLSVNTNMVTSSLTLQGGLTNTQLPTPAQPTVATAGTAGTTTYGYKVTAIDGTGETLPSTERTIATGNATLDSTNYNVITWSQVPGAVQYKVYRTTSAGTPASTGLIATVTGANNVFFNDTGIAAGVIAPVANTTGGATFAGGIQGSTASLSGSLTVAGATTLNGTLTATGTALFKNTADSATAFQIQDSSSNILFNADTTTAKITVRTLDVTFNLTVAGHIISSGSTPAIAADTAACTSPTVNVSGTDTAGLITVTTGTGCAAPGLLSSVTFATAFGAAPRVTLTPASGAAASLNAYLDDASISTTGFTIGAVNTPADATVYKWHYHALQ